MFNKKYIYFIIIIILFIKVYLNTNNNCENFDNNNNTITNKINEVSKLIKYLKKSTGDIEFDKQVNMYAPIKSKKINLNVNLNNLFPVGTIVPYYTYYKYNKAIFKKINKIIEMKKGNENINYNTVDGNTTNEKIKNVLNQILDLQGRSDLYLTTYVEGDVDYVFKYGNYYNNKFVYYNQQIKKNVEENKEEIEKKKEILNYYLELYDLEKEVNINIRNNVNNFTNDFPKNYALCDGNYYKKYLELNDYEENPGISEESFNRLNDNMKKKYVRTPNLINKTIKGYDTDFNTNLEQNEDRDKLIEEYLNNYNNKNSIESIDYDYGKIKISNDHIPDHTHRLLTGYESLKTSNRSLSIDQPNLSQRYILMHNDHTGGAKDRHYKTSPGEDNKPADMFPTQENRETEITLVIRTDIIKSFGIISKSILRERLILEPTLIYKIIYFNNNESLNNLLENDINFRIKFVFTINIYKKNFLEPIQNWLNTSDMSDEYIFNFKMFDFTFYDLQFYYNLIDDKTLEFYLDDNITVKDFFENKKSIIKIKTKDNDIESIKDSIYLLDTKIPIQGYDENHFIHNIKQNNLFDLVIMYEPIKKFIEMGINKILNNNFLSGEVENTYDNDGSTTDIYVNPDKKPEKITIPFSSFVEYIKHLNVGGTPMDDFMSFILNKNKEVYIGETNPQFITKEILEVNDYYEYNEFFTNKTYKLNLESKQEDNDIYLPLKPKNFSFIKILALHRLFVINKDIIYKDNYIINNEYNMNQLFFDRYKAKTIRPIGYTNGDKDNIKYFTYMFLHKFDSNERYSTQKIYLKPPNKQLVYLMKI